MSDFSQLLTDLPTGGVISTAGPHSLSWGYSLASGATYATTTAALSAKRVVYQAVIVPETVTVTHLAVYMVTATGNVDIGIYPDGDRAGKLIVSTGSTAASGASAIQSFDITDTTLVPGMYWLAITSDSAPEMLGSESVCTAANAATAMTRGIGVQFNNFPLPATAGIGGPGANLIDIPVVFAMTRTTF